jgi:hypothetical protein
MKTLFAVIFIVLAMVVTAATQAASGADANGNSDTFEWGAPSSSVPAHSG